MLIFVFLKEISTDSNMEAGLEGELEGRQGDLLGGY